MKEKKFRKKTKEQLLNCVRDPGIQGYINIG
jgi:hypothetical protein